MSKTNIENGTPHATVEDLEPVLNTHQRKIVGVAKVVHEATRAFNETLGDFTYGPWSTTPPWYQRILVECITFLLTKNMDVNQLHIYWSGKMVENGWKYGLLMNPKTKEHPNIKNFKELAFEE